MTEIEYSEFEKVDIRLAVIEGVKDFPEARNPSYKLTVNLGDNIGLKKSIAQLPANYTKDELIGKRVACVVNLGTRQIGPSKSEVLTVGFPDKDGNALLLEVHKNALIGSKLH